MKGRKGIFVCDRNEISLKIKLNILTKIITKIKKTMLKNFFIQKKILRMRLLKILNNEF